MSLKNQIKQIRAYTHEHPELLRAHHFLYDKPLANPGSQFNFAVLGVNPGEQEGDWNDWPNPTEETSLFDFREELGKRPAASKRWRELVQFFCGTDHVIMSEFFFWSSKNTGRDFVEKFGHSIGKSQHLSFCTKLNQELIDAYRVQAVIAPGLKSLNLFGRAYGLEPVASIVDKKTGHTLVEHYRRGNTPWIFTKHWTASFGFSDAQRKTVKGYIANICKPAYGSPMQSPRNGKTISLNSDLRKDQISKGDERPRPVYRGGKPTLILGNELQVALFINHCLPNIITPSGRWYNAPPRNHNLSFMEVDVRVAKQGERCGANFDPPKRNYNFNDSNWVNQPEVSKALLETARQVTGSDLDRAVVAEELRLIKETLKGSANAG